MTILAPKPIAVLDATHDDASWLLRLNNAAEPHVNALSEREFVQLMAWSAFTLKAVGDEKAIGMLVCLPSGVPYASANYRHLSDLYDSFLYVDRIAVAEDARGFGAGRALYEEMAKRAVDRWPRVLCEVNEQPSNPASMAFHHRMGFQDLDTFDNPESGKRVRFMELPL